MSTIQYPDAVIKIHPFPCPSPLTAGALFLSQSPRPSMTWWGALVYATAKAVALLHKSV